MRKEKNDKDQLQGSYPRPSQSDSQLKDQPEFIEQKPNDFEDESVGNVSTEEGEKEEE